jgi:hypothetical protein
MAEERYRIAHCLTDGLDFAIRSTNSANVERLQHLNNARSLAVRDLESLNAARISTDNTSRAVAPEPTRFQLRMNFKESIRFDWHLQRSECRREHPGTIHRDTGVRARIAGDLDTIGTEILAR